MGITMVTSPSNSDVTNRYATNFLMDDLSSAQKKQYVHTIRRLSTLKQMLL